MVRSPHLSGPYSGPHPVGVNDLPSLERVLIEWERPDGTASGIHAGDLGWLQRLGPEHAANQTRTWRDATGRTVAVLLMFGPEESWLGLDPWHWFDPELAHEAASWIADPANDIQAIDGPPTPAAWRSGMARLGFRQGQVRVRHLWKPLGPDDIVEVLGVFDTTDPAQIADRVAVQKSAFERSTFTVEKWHQMAQSTVFDPGLDLLVRNEAGEATAAATFWFAGAGRCARLEPLGTDPRFRRQGHARRLLAAGFSRLAQAGASGVTVFGVGDNEAAIGLYEAAGFIRLGAWHDLVRPRG